jgi:copper chaperone CopZ
MSQDVSQDQLALLKVEGMHCHKCEQTLRNALTRNRGVHEVEVDFASGQASVLFDRSAVTVRQLVDSVQSAGYHVTGFTQNNADKHA